MLTRKTPDVLATTLTLTGQGETITFGVTYRNLDEDQTKELFDGLDLSETQNMPVLKIIESWESEYKLTPEDMLAAEKARPGLIQGLINGFHQARAVHVSGNSARR